MNFVCSFSLILSLLLIASCSNQTLSESTTPELGNASQTVDIQASCDAPSNDIRAAMLSLINEARTQPRNCGSVNYPATDALVWDDNLRVAADNHNSDMTQHDFFNHTGSDGLEASDRVTAAGYPWANVGENLAGGQTSARDVVLAWIDSPGHCANVMNRRFQNIGVGCQSSTTNSLGTYWTAVFAAKR